MRSGQLAAACGVHPETLRYYERLGLLPSPPRDRSGYRDYPDTAVQRVRSIKQAQKLGLSLAEIHDLLRRSPTGAITCGNLSARIETKIAEIDGKIADLQALHDLLENLLCTCCRARDPNRTCEQTSAPLLSITAASSTGIDSATPPWRHLAAAKHGRNGRRAVAVR